MTKYETMEWLVIIGASVVIVGSVLAIIFKIPVVIN